MTKRTFKYSFYCGNKLTLFSIRYDSRFTRTLVNSACPSGKFTFCSMPQNFPLTDVRKRKICICEQDEIFVCFIAKQHPGPTLAQAKAIC